MTFDLYTIGHSAHPISHLLHLLEMHGIRLVIDVRSTPSSRFHPQYNRVRLEQSLGERGIRYAWLGEQLGGRPSDPSCYPEESQPTRDRGGHRRPDFGLVMEKPWFQEGIANLLELVQSDRAAILCSEADPRDCHRKILIETYLKKAQPGVRVVHILKNGETMVG
jgi:uncharacterized protein (DUF488 family)